MPLQFELTQIVTSGGNPAGVHFQDNIAKVLYTSSGKLYGIDTTTPNGEWANRVFGLPSIMTSDLGIEYLTLRRISRYGLYGSWHSEDRHRFAIYGLEYDVWDYLEEGSIEFSINNPIASLSLSIINPNEGFTGEDSSFILPGSKIVLSFTSGDSEPYPMGTFFVDGSGYDVFENDVEISARNTIGKLLKDQTFDEQNSFTIREFHQLIKDILAVGGISSSKYWVDERATFNCGLEFPSNMSLLDGIKSALNIIQNSNIAELLDGTIVVGFNDYEKFDQPASYVFYRDKDVWSREVVRDDMETYQRVCVHTEDMSIKVYRDTQGIEGWGIGNQKTQYISMPDGTSLQECTDMADYFAITIPWGGIIETFTGAFRPHIQPRDEAVITASDGSTKLIGLITSVTHRFGKDGFSTEFVVDSGGRKGRGRLSDYIERISKREVTVGSVKRLY